MKSAISNEAAYAAGMIFLLVVLLLIGNGF